MDTRSAWEDVKENIKKTAKNSIGFTQNIKNSQFLIKTSKFTAKLIPKKLWITN